MCKALNKFVPKKKYLLCVDSDGCAMDTMNVKHIKCFGPKFVKVFNITKNVQGVLDRWNKINLYQRTRGINRFKGLAKILCELYPKDTACAEFKVWTDTSNELSEAALQQKIKEGAGEIFKKALLWSQATNVAIKALPDDNKEAFEGVYEALKEAGDTFGSICLYCNRLISGASYILPPYFPKVNIFFHFFYFFIFYVTIHPLPIKEGDFSLLTFKTPRRSARWYLSFDASP